MTAKQIASSKASAKPHKQRGISIVALQRQTGISRPTLMAWEKAGMPTTNAHDALDWIRQNRSEHLNTQLPNSDPAKWSKTDWEKFRIQKQCRDLDWEHEIRKGEYHRVDECSQSLGAILTERLQPFLSLHQRIKSRWPELPQGAMEAIKTEVDEAFEAIRTGLKEKEEKTP